MKNSPRERAHRWFFLAFLTCVLCVTLFPFLWMVSSSFQDPVELGRKAHPFIPTKLTLENYRLLLSSVNLPMHFLNSLLYAGGVMILSLFFNSLAAFAFACLRFPGREKLFTLLMMTLMVPLQVTLLPLFLTLKYLGLLNSIAGLVLPASATVVGIFLIRQFMLDLPQEILEQARLDGCSELQLFRLIVMPMCRPILATMAVFTFVGTWNEFLGPLVIMLRESGYPLPVALASLNTQRGGEMGLLMAGAVLTVLPSVLVFLLAQRHYLKGITAGAIR